MFTIDDLIASKQDPHDMFGNGYNFVFLHIENFLISKLDGAQRAADFIKHYDNDALVLVYFQLKAMKSSAHIDLTTELFNIIGMPEINEAALKKVKQNIISL